MTLHETEKMSTSKSGGETHLYPGVNAIGGCGRRSTLWRDPSTLPRRGSAHQQHQPHLRACEECLILSPPRAHCIRPCHSAALGPRSPLLSTSSHHGQEQSSGVRWQHRNPGSALCWLCDLGQIAYPHLSLVSPSIKWAQHYFPGLLEG